MTKTQIIITACAGIAVAGIAVWYWRSTAPDEQAALNQAIKDASGGATAAGAQGGGKITSRYVNRGDGRMGWGQAS